jgi:hypothetical protein
MKRTVLLISLMGLFLLILINNFSTPIKISSQNEINNLVENEKVIVSGIVINEKTSTNNIILTLNNNVSVYYDSITIKSLKGKNITVIGIIDTYQRNKINALEFYVR